MSIKIKRVYEKPAVEDGKRVLVDRLWPRGISKERAQLDLWLKDAAPSPTLRKWFAHSQDKFNEFKKIYQEELESDPVHIDAAKQLFDLAQKGNVTLLYGAKDSMCNHAVVLEEWINRNL